jgi:hypothetical protein
MILKDFLKRPKQQLAILFKKDLKMLKLSTKSFWAIERLDL